MKNIKILSFVCFTILLTFFIGSKGVNATTCASITDTTAYRACLVSLEFPDSYLDKLITLHATYPNWEFQPTITGLDWENSVKVESDIPENIYNSKSRLTDNVGYRSIDERVYNAATDKWIPLESGVWYATNKETVSYYMDPRNFLDLNRIFMFESLGYESSYQTEAVVDAALPNGPYYDETYTLQGNYNLDDYSAAFMTAASNYNINPVFLAVRVKQEGAYLTNSANGKQITCTSDKLPDWYGYTTYSGTGFYNLYNIYATGSNVTCTAVAYASNGYGSTHGDGTYGRPWNTISKSIIGGAQFIGEKYITPGQNTLYSQKFDIVGPGYYNNQYMTNIQVAYSEGYSEYDGYNNIGLVNASSTFLFKIPVYTTMPSSTSLPVNANPNSYLSALTVDGTNITGFTLPTKYELNKTFNYTLLVSTSTNSITIDGTTVNSTASISGEGTVSLPNATNVINVIGTAANGNTTTYTITVVKSDEVPITTTAVINNMNLKLSSSYVSGIALGTTGATLSTLANSTSSLVSTVVKNTWGNEISTAVGTGCTITINNTLTTATYTIVERGDTNGDAAISIKDLLIVQKHLLKSSTLSGAYYQGADINKDGSVTIKDLLLVQKHLLGSSYITQ